MERDNLVNFLNSTQDRWKKFEYYLTIGDVKFKDNYDILEGYATIDQIMETLSEIEKDPRNFTHFDCGDSEVKFLEWIM